MCGIKRNSDQFSQGNYIRYIYNLYRIDYSTSDNVTLSILSFFLLFSLAVALVVAVIPTPT